MPELPEVEVVRAGLAPAVSGARVAAVTVLDDRALTRHPGTAADFEARLTGRTMQAAARRGKFLWLPLLAEAPEESVGVVAHLGMSGQLLLRPAGSPPERHERVRLDVQHPEHGELAVVFADQRTFGSQKMCVLATSKAWACQEWLLREQKSPRLVYGEAAIFCANFVRRFSSQFCADFVPLFAKKKHILIRKKLRFVHSLNRSNK